MTKHAQSERINMHSQNDQILTFRMIICAVRTTTCIQSEQLNINIENDYICTVRMTKYEHSERLNMDKQND